MSDRPHILILMPDQFRADALGCAGHPVVRTPSIDRLAAGGVRFSRAATNCPLCMPARAAFISGQYPHNFGMWGNAKQLPAEAPSFFRQLQTAGYHTAHFGKSHYYEHHSGAHLRDEEPYMHARGFETVHETTGPHATFKTRSYMSDHWEKAGLLQTFLEDMGKRRAGLRQNPPEHMTHPSPMPADEHMDSYVGRTAMEFVQGYQDERPMCLFVGFAGPHEPWDPPAEYAAMYRPEDMPPAIPAEPHGPHVPASARHQRDFERLKNLTPDKIAAIRALYYGKISLIDHWIGRILGEFDKRGWRDDLCVIFWSDHGEMAGDHGLLCKHVFYEGSLRVPMIVRWPGCVPAGQVRDALAETVDISATVLDAAGANPAVGMLGKSLLPVARDAAAPLRDTQLSEVFFGSRHMMIATDRYKYAVDQDGSGYQLIDLQEDPREQRNLMGDPAAAGLEREMRDRLLCRLAAEQVCM